MSNEKLGAEQGRDASFKAFSDYVKKLCAILDEEGIETEQIDCDLHNLAENLLVKQMLGTLIAQPRTEQAYHARGAAAIREAAEIIEEVYQDLGALRGISPATYNRIIKWRREPGAGRTCHCGTPSEPHNESVHEEAWAEHILKMATRREPGADTGTTPPEGLRELVEKSRETQARMNEHANALHDYFAHSTETTEPFDWIEYHRKCIVVLRKKHEPQRTDESDLDYAKRVDILTEPSNFDVVESAATQRAPVEQGRETKED